ncbi:MAG: hypothetical protein K5864_03545 [Bacteroidales bacterium]|nr:hypothetical protein [Bacteroidales bacterium]
MKKRVFLLTLIFAFLGTTVPVGAQIVTRYTQGFEQSGEQFGYTVNSGTAAPQTSVFSAGSRALKMSHTNEECVVTTDTIDLSDNPAYSQFFLEFMHINTVVPNECQSPQEVGIIQVKRVGSDSWLTLDGVQAYDMSWGGGSSDFAGNPSFSDHSYDSWTGANASNTMWKRERFNLNNVLGATSQANRKLQVRFVLKPRTASGTTTKGWYLDNIQVKCSQWPMTLPTLTMRSYPELENYPHSRAVRVEAEIGTAVTVGMHPDSVYLVYQLGTNQPYQRTTMTLVSGNNSSGVYRGYIPFCGFDTLVHWHLVARDATLNFNTVTFPTDESAWMSFKCVRGYDNFVMMPSTSAENAYPFPNYGIHKSQFIYDSAYLASLGYRPGAITQLRYTAASNANNNYRDRFSIQMTNIPSSYGVVSTENSVPYYPDWQKVVYDSALVITQNNGTVGIINLQDTFFYAGKNILVTVRELNSQHGDPPAFSIRQHGVGTHTGSVVSSYPANSGDVSPFASSATNQLFASGQYANKRPALQMRQWGNAPLMYDCGISGFVNPNDSTPANATGNNNVVLTLKNYGAQPINAVRIYYKIDGGASQYYDWTGTLAAYSTINVTVNTTQTYTTGYHEMLAWVDDSVTFQGNNYRDHEPYNDTLWTRFIACAGPMSGTITVGQGAGYTYNSLENCLYALSQCGVNGPLTVKLAAGTYYPTTWPAISGTSATNVVTFEPEHPTQLTVQFTPEGGNIVTPQLVNLQQSNHIRFNRIRFVTNNGGMAATYHVRLGIASTGCIFDNCEFTESHVGGAATVNQMYSPALLYSGGCDSLVVRGCTFNRGTAGISLVGPAIDNLAHGSKIQGNTFNTQGTNGVIVRNQIGVTVDSNTFNDVYANSSYVILIQDCHGASKITRNLVYVTSGASCLGATGLIGSSSGYAIVANNFLISDDDGTSNMLTTPLNIINAEYAKVVFNSVKLMAPSRGGIAAATFGGSEILNSQFYNNIVACVDTSNFAFNYIPTSGATNYIGYNIYYSNGPVLNKYNGVNCMTMSTWLAQYPQDNSSQNVNPAFLNSTVTDLRSYSQNVKNHAMPIAEVTDDIFGTQRDATSPCVGGFEFSSLPYDFEIIDMLSPDAEYCDGTASASIELVIKNSGVNAFTPGTQNLTLTYSRTTTPGVMVGGLSGNVSINRTIPANDTIHFATTATLQFPVNGLLDSTYQFYFWLTSTIDPNPANDTTGFTVTSNYHFPAPNAVNMTVGYSTQATVAVSNGVQTWRNNVYNSSRADSSTVYWYDAPTSTIPFFRGNTYTTGILYSDTTFYIRQRRSLGLVKISEVQLRNNGDGVTYPMPTWMNATSSGGTVAVELMNVGDGPVNLLGDTMQLVSSTSAFNKTFVMPNVTIEPHQMLVVQWRTGMNTVDSTKTIGTNIAVAGNNQNYGNIHFAVLYRDGHGLVDAVAFNNITNLTQWTNQQVPTWVWAGSGITLEQTSTGVIRKGWPTNASQTPSNTQQFWQTADASHMMTMGTPNSNVVRFTDNGCESDYTTVTIHIASQPQVDLELDSLAIPSGCGVGVEPITVTIYNHGMVQSDTVTARLKLNGTLVCSDVLSPIPAHGQTIHTFSLPIDFTVTSGTQTFNVEVLVDHQNNDVTLFNDTVRQQVESSYQPGVVSVNHYDTVQYGQRAILTSNAAVIADSLVWYDRNMNVLDTINIYETNYLYGDDTFYVSALGTVNRPTHVGTLATMTGATAFPSPYNPNKKYVREQYLYLASQLIEAGHSAGVINSVSFYLDTIMAPAGTMTFDYFTVSMDTTSKATFTSNGNWLPVTARSTQNSLTISNASKGWITHNFQTPFVWDGVSNIVVQVTHALPAAITQGARTRYTNGGANTVLYKNDNNNDLSNTTANGSRSPNRPDILFGFDDPNCEGPTTPIYVAVENRPACDLALQWPAGWDTVSFSSCGNNNLDVTITNLGGSPASNYTINYWVDTTMGTYSGTTTLAPQATSTITVATPSFTPGRHQLTAVVIVSDDTIHTNDTIHSTINVSFCTGTYTIGATGDYANFTTAIDTLYHAGVDGAVVFEVQNGIYNEQIQLGSVRGASALNTVTFRSASGNASDVMLRYQPVQANNYVINIDGARFVTFKNMSFYANASGNYSNVINLANVENIHFENAVVRVKGTVNHVNSSCVIVGENVHYLYFDSCWIDSGYYGVRSMVPVLGSSYGLFLTNSHVTNFWSMGVYLRKLDEVYITGNNVRSGVNISSRALTGIFVAEHNGPLTLEANNVVLSDQRNGGKQGIHLARVSSSNALRSTVYNNMTACVGTNTAGIVSAGIWLDTCEYINVYYNTCNVNVGLNMPTTCAFTVRGSGTGAYVMNNVFTNQSKGYAYYAQLAANITTSNYNNYYSNSPTRLAYWGGVELPTFEELRQQNSQDANSYNMPAYYVSPDDLHLSIGSFCELAQYNTAVPKDIDGTTRPQIPSPTMGAHEYARSIHNIAVTDVYEPELGVSTVIEGDSMKIVVRLFNDGTSTESNLTWWAELDGTGNTNTSSQMMHIAEMQPQSEVIDSTWIVVPMGAIDTHNIIIHFPMANDSIPANNTLIVPVFINMRWNLQASNLVVESGDGCRLHNTVVSITLTNTGMHAVPTTYPVQLGFQATLNTAGVTVPTLPISFTETQTLPSEIEPLASVTMTFNNTFNLYPTSIAKDIQVRCRANVTYQWDQKPNNDTTSNVNVTSKYTPSSPVAPDLHIPYATWDTIFASHTDVPPTGAQIHRPIRWYRDSLAEPFHAPNNYNASTWWETPQYFHDSVYFLSCVSTTGCTSYYSQAHVYLNPRVNPDAAIVSIEEPLPHMVYMSQDSVKVGIINYGTAPISNIPVVYQLFSQQNQLLQEVHEVCPATIQPDQVYVYRFDSLMNIPAWGQNYKLRTWTDLANEQVRLNDTLRNIYQFTALTEQAYQLPNIANTMGLDIVHVAYSSLDNLLPEIGHDYINFANYTNPAVPVLHMIKGTQDTMIIEVANSDDYSDYNTSGYLSVYIDYDRDGTFYLGDDYQYNWTELVYGDTVRSRNPEKFLFTLPDSIALGYMRMRIILQQAGIEPKGPNGEDAIEFGCAHDYLLYIEDVPPLVDIAATRIVAPRSPILDSANVPVTFMISNKGATPITEASISYTLIDGDPTDHSARGVINWTGDLQPGHSVEVALPDRPFKFGTTTVKLVAETAGDTIPENDTIWYEYHLFDTITLRLVDYFETKDIWYAPRGYNAYGTNLFQRGVPNKPNIMTAMSDSCVWATNLTGFVMPGNKGNLSFLYTPKINISQIRPDTIEFWMASDIAEGHTLTMEFYDYQGKWQTMGSANDTLWYNSGEGWTGTSPGYTYVHYVFPTSLVSGDFQQLVQFRFVYHARPGSDPCDGVAIDNFVVGKARRNVDVGVVALTYPLHPQFGQTLNPHVIIKNFGLDTIYEVSLAYRPYGAFLAKTGTFISETGLAPNETAMYSFSDPFIVRSDFPDTFQICAYTTVNMDIYLENDTTCMDFILSPLDNDMAMVSFLSPTDRIVAGDSITVTTRLRNYGQAPVSQCEVTYVYNGNVTYTETVNFVELLGRELQSFEYFNYTFHHRVRASMGTMSMTAFVNMPNDDYVYNDTIDKTINGISAITDLKAREVLVERNFQNVYIHVTIDNVGARSVTDFDVGFWYYNDTNTLIRRHVHLEDSDPFAALTTMHYRFPDTLPAHNEYYNYVTAFVFNEEDNDRSNDTTNVIGTPIVDFRAVEVLVEENREDECHVRLAIENVGNINSTLDRKITITAKINGDSITTKNIQRVIAPGEIYSLDFTPTIPKSPSRTYVGTGYVTQVEDVNVTNNQTSAVRAINYFEGIPVAPKPTGMTLDQNYPNPYESVTNIQFHLPTAGDVRFFVMDEMGRMVYQRSEHFSEGDHTIQYGDSRLSSGVYYYGIEMNGERLMRKMTFKR